TPALPSSWHRDRPIPLVAPVTKAERRFVASMASACHVLPGGSSKSGPRPTAFDESLVAILRPFRASAAREGSFFDSIISSSRDGLFTGVREAQRPNSGASTHSFRARAAERAF